MINYRVKLKVRNVSPVIDFRPNLLNIKMYIPTIEPTRIESWRIGSVQVLQVFAQPYQQLEVSTCPLDGIGLILTIKSTMSIDEIQPLILTEYTRWPNQQGRGASITYTTSVTHPSQRGSWSSVTSTSGGCRASLIHPLQRLWYSRPPPLKEWWIYILVKDT